MNNLEKKIIQAIEQENDEELLEVFQTISFKISKGLGTFSNISCPFYVAVLQQYANALMNNMDENGRDPCKSVNRKFKPLYLCGISVIARR